MRDNSVNINNELGETKIYLIPFIDTPLVRNVKLVLTSAIGHKVEIGQKNLLTITLLNDDKTNVCKPWDQDVTDINTEMKGLIEIVCQIFQTTPQIKISGGCEGVLKWEDPDQIIEHLKLNGPRKKRLPSEKIIDSLIHHKEGESLLKPIGYVQPEISHKMTKEELLKQSPQELLDSVMDFSSKSNKEEIMNAQQNKININDKMQARVKAEEDLIANMLIKNKAKPKKSCIAKNKSGINPEEAGPTIEQKIPNSITDNQVQQTNLPLNQNQIPQTNLPLNSNLIQQTNQPLNSNLIQQTNQPLNSHHIQETKQPLNSNEMLQTNQQLNNNDGQLQNTILYFYKNKEAMNQMMEVLYKVQNINNANNLNNIPQNYIQNQPTMNSKNMMMQDLNLNIKNNQFQQTQTILNAEDLNEFKEVNKVIKNHQEKLQEEKLFIDQLKNDKDNKNEDINDIMEILGLKEEDSSIIKINNENENENDKRYEINSEIDISNLAGISIEKINMTMGDIKYEEKEEEVKSEISKLAKKNESQLDNVNENENESEIEIENQDSDNYNLRGKNKRKNVKKGKK